MRPFEDEKDAKVGAALFEAFAEGSAVETTWDELLKHRVCLLVGPAHCGKTSELKLLRRRLRDRDRTCFMLDLGTLVRSTVDDAMGADRSAFGEWCQGDTEGIFLLDALDEAELCDDKALLVCINKVTSCLGLPALRRSRFVVSSRPGSWSSADVLDTIRDGLCEQVALLGEPSEADVAVASLFEATGDAKSDRALIFASLPPLTKGQASKLLKSVHGVENPAALQDKAWNLGLAFALRNPGSLGWLARVIPKLQTGDGRLRAYELAVSELVRMGFERRRQATPFSEDDVFREIERLCAASFFCQKYLFSLRASPSDDGAVSLREALAHRSANFETLLQTFPFFIDSGIQRLKLLPSELQPFLVARWLVGRIKSGSMSVDDVLDLFVLTSFAGELIPSQFEVVAGWLSSMDSEFARRILGVAPHAVLLYGDLSSLPHPLAEAALRETIGALASGRALLYRTVRLTSDDYWQAMRPDLVPTVVSSIDKFAHNEECWDLLTRMVASRGCVEAVPALKRQLTNPRASDSARVRAVDAIGECGRAADVEWAVDGLFARGLFNTRAATISLQSLLQRSRSVDRLRRILRSGLFESIAASVYVQDLIEHDPSKADAMALVATLKEAAVGISEPGADAFMKLLVSSVAALLSRDDLAEADYVGLLDTLEVVRLQAEERDFDRFDNIPPLIRVKPELQRLAVRRLVRGLGKERLWKLRSHTEELYAHISEADIETLEQLKTELSDAELVDQVQDLIEGVAPRKPPRAERRAPDRSANSEPTFAVDKAQVEAKAETIASCADPGMLTRLVNVATDGRLRTSLGVEQWDLLAAKYGMLVSAAVQAGLRRLWRDHLPLEDGNNPQIVYAQTVAGLAGVVAEIADAYAARALNLAEAEQAMRYSLYELNHFPPYMALLVDTRFDECDAFYASVVGRWKTSPKAAEHAKHVVARMPDKLVAGDTRCRAAVWSYLKTGPRDSYYEVEQALTALCKWPDDPELAAFLDRRSRQCWNERCDDFAAYLSAWVRVQPGPALAFLADCAGEPSRQVEIVGLASYWSRNRESPLSGMDSDSEKLATHLEKLYEVMAMAAPPATDPYRTGAFSPDARDNACRFRSSILGMIEALGSHAAYVASRRLAVKFKEEASMAHMLDALAVRIAERAALPHPWTTAQFVDFSRDAMAVPVDDEQSLWRRVRRDTRSAVQNVLLGRFHVGDLLKRGKERDMQLWLSRELELLSQQAYSVQRESELADRTMPDIRAETPRHMATLELKVADDRTVDSMLFDLEWQLKGDYLRDKRSNHGIFVVMHQGSRTSFPFQKRALSFNELQQVLVRRADELTGASLGKKHVEVIAFECPSGHSPRNNKRSTRRNRSAA